MGPNEARMIFFLLFQPTQKMGPDGPKWGQEDFFPTNSDLAYILGRTDFDFENYHFGIFGDPNFQISRIPETRSLAWSKLGPGRAWAGLRLGPTLAGPGLGRPRLGELIAITALL